MDIMCWHFFMVFIFFISVVFHPLGFNNNFNSFIEGWFFLVREVFLLGKLSWLLRHPFMVSASFLVTISNVLSKSPLLNQLLYCILQMDALICIVHMTLMKTTIFWLVCPIWFFDRVWIFDHDFLEVSSRTLFLDVLPRSIQGSVGG